MTAVAFLLAMAGGATALGVDFAHCSGAQFADGADTGQNPGASLLEGTEGTGEGRRGVHFLIISPIKIGAVLSDGITRTSNNSSPKSGRDQNDVLHPRFRQGGRVRVLGWSPGQNRRLMSLGAEKSQLDRAVSSRPHITPRADFKPDAATRP